MISGFQNCLMGDFSFTLVTDTFRLLVLLSNALIAFVVCGRSGGLG